MVTCIWVQQTQFFTILYSAQKSSVVVIRDEPPSSWTNSSIRTYFLIQQTISKTLFSRTCFLGLDGFFLYRDETNLRHRRCDSLAYYKQMNGCLRCKNLLNMSLISLLQFRVLFLHQWCHLPDTCLLLPLDMFLTRAGECIWTVTMQLLQWWPRNTVIQDIASNSTHLLLIAC